MWCPKGKMYKITVVLLMLYMLKVATALFHHINGTVHLLS